MQLRRVVAVVAALNLAYFFVEFAVAQAIGSVSLFADSVDFLEDTAVNALIFLGLGWTASRRARLGMALSAVLLLPALSFCWSLWSKYQAPVPPEPWALSITGIGALSVNLVCALLLARFRNHSGSLTKAAFLSARNDALANIAIVSAGLLTAVNGSVWPDVVVGLGIACMNADAASEVWAAARVEQSKSSTEP